MSIQLFSSVVSLMTLLLFVSSCGVSNVGNINITRVGPDGPKPVLQIFNTDLIGTTTTMPTSASAQLVDHHVSKTTKETNSVSTSFRLTGGIGVE